MLEFKTSARKISYLPSFLGYLLLSLVFLYFIVLIIDSLKQDAFFLSFDSDFINISYEIVKSAEQRKHECVFLKMSEWSIRRTWANLHVTCTRDFCLESNWKAWTWPEESKAFLSRLAHDDSRIGFRHPTHSTRRKSEARKHASFILESMISSVVRTLNIFLQSPLAWGSLLRKRHSCVENKSTARVRAYRYFRSSFLLSRRTLVYSM